MTTKVGVISSLLLEQEIIMSLEVGQEPATGLTTGLVVDPSEVGGHIPSIMQIFRMDRRAGNFITVGVEAEAMETDFRGAEGVMG